MYLPPRSKSKMCLPRSKSKMYLPLGSRPRERPGADGRSGSMRVLHFALRSSFELFAVHTRPHTRHRLESGRRVLCPGCGPVPCRLWVRCALGRVSQLPLEIAGLLVWRVYTVATDTPRRSPAQNFRYVGTRPWLRAVPRPRRPSSGPVPDGDAAATADGRGARTRDARHSRCATRDTVRLGLRLRAW